MANVVQLIIKTGANQTKVSKSNKILIEWSSVESCSFSLECRLLNYDHDEVDITVNAALGLVAGLVEEVRRKQRSFLYLENQIMYIIFM